MQKYRIQEELAQVSAQIRDGRRLEALKAEAIAQRSPFTMQPILRRFVCSEHGSHKEVRGFAEETQDVCHR